MSDTLKIHSWPLRLNQARPLFGTFVRDFVVPNKTFGKLRLPDYHSRKAAITKAAGRGTPLIGP